jgi:ferredoxin
MSIQVTIDADECIGCQTCVEICPEVFDFDQETEKAQVRDRTTGNEGCIQEAVDSCPTSCIKTD